MNNNDYRFVLEHIYLENNAAWPFPIGLDGSEDEVKNFAIDDNIILTDSAENPITLLEFLLYFQKFFICKLTYLFLRFSQSRWF
jgi:ATP sulfurylase